MNTRFFAVAAMLAGISPQAFSHPGHGPASMAHSDTVLHPFFGSEHLLLLAAIGGVAWWLQQRARRGNRHDGE